MKKRITTAVIALLLVVCLLWVPSMAEEPAPAEFMAGYAQVDITPNEALPLAGYGDAERIYTEIESRLYVTAIAMTDKYDTTALFLSVDSYNSNQMWSNDAKAAIVETLAEQKVDMDIDRIYISATTTMSAPELIYSGIDPEMKEKVDAYRQTVIAACAQAAQEAYADRTAVTMYHNNMDASEGIVHLKTEAGETVQDGDPVTRLNYNNHYNVVSKTDPSQAYVAGVGFGPNGYLNNNNYTVTEVNQPDDTMGLLIFRPTDGVKDPIVLANWSAKANISSSGTNRYGAENKNALSADYVGFFRDEMAENGMRTAFFQGTSGNVSAFPLAASMRNTEVMEDVAYTEEVDGEIVENSAPSITPKLYGEKLAQLALHGLTHEDGENHLHAADMDAPINNYKFRFAVEPDVPTDVQVELVNFLKMTEVPAVAEDDVDPGMAVYANLYEYLQGNWDEAKPVAVQMLTDGEKTDLANELAGMVKATQLAGIATRMAHTVNAATTNFATDAVYCDATLLQLGKMTFVMAPADLYDFYGEEGTIKDWNHVGAHFVLGNTNGASGYLPNAASYHYNENSDQYITGTNNTWSTIFPEGAGEQLMETYINVKKTMTATEDDPENQIRMQCECGGLAAGQPGHTCEIKAFYPWYDKDSLPVSGNYYLMTDVTILREARTGTAEKSIDLNGHTITRKVLREVMLDQTGTEIPAKDYYTGTRLFALEQHARLTITDTAGGGKLTRDVSDLDAVSLDEQKKIGNYGLLVAIIDGNTSEFILYNGILDATGQYSGGGACVANMSTKATFTMYDGQLIGGISDRGAAVYAGGTNKFYGGAVTGGQVADTSDEGDTAEKNGSVNLLTTGTLLLAGDATISGGKLDSDDCNLVINNSNSLSVDENYIGTAGISVKVDDPNGTIIGWLENVPESAFDNLSVDNYDTYEVMLCNRNAVVIGQIRTYCECGGKAAGKHDHVCQDIQWKPWPVAYNKYLPDSDIGGNYYLLTDINLVNQKVVGAELHLDLNGHNVTHVVTPGEKTLEELNTAGTRVFYVGAGGSLTITDSTANPGTVTRDLSLLSEEQKAGITNYGIMMLMNDETTGDFVLYDGILDATGQLTGGGVLANLNPELAIRIYGGEIRGGIAPNGGGIYSQGNVWIHEGIVTGGQSTGNGVGGIILTTTGHLYLCGDASVTGNTNKNGAPANIKASSAEQITVADDFEGTVGIMLNKQPTHLMKVAKSNGVDLAKATVTGETYTEGYALRVVDGYIVTYLDAAYITYEGETPVSYHETLQGAFNAYPGGKATITLRRDVAEDGLFIEKLTYLDLAGFDLAGNGFTANGFKLYVFDSETDDYTVENGNGYGLVTGAIAEAAEGLPYDSDIVTAVKTTDLYLKITEGDGTSFHRLNLRFAGITLRPDSLEDGSYAPGLYYNSQFGGDEVIKRNITAYGVGMSAVEGEELFTRENSYTEMSAEKWLVGADRSGNSNNLQNGTILTGIMKSANPTIINRRNGNVQVRGQNYVMLQNGTRVVGPEVSYSLKDVFEGNGMIGVDERWDSWGASTQTSILRLFETYNSVMRHWAIPNIKEAAAK